MKIVMVWYQHDWGLYGRRYEMIARTWARLNPEDEILVVEPPLNPWTWLKNTLAALRARDSGLFRYWRDQLKNIGKGPCRVSENLWHVQPFLLWPFSNRTQSGWTRFSYGKAWNVVETFINQHQWSEPLLWAYPPHAFVEYASNAWKNNHICVDLVDDNTQVSSMPESLRQSFHGVYENILSRAKVVFAVSDNLLKNMRVSKALGTCVPNGISGDLEITANWSLPPLPSGPRACYVGRIDERLDLDLISYLAKKNQDIQFVFIGPIEPSFRKQWSMVVGELSNVHAWGTVPYLNVGAALKSMDVCLMPHLDTPLTRSMDPLKIYVYLAAGKKVVSTKVQMTARMEKLISTAETNDEFSNVLRRCIESKNGATLNLLDELWENRVRQMEKPLRAQSTFLVA